MASVDQIILQINIQIFEVVSVEKRWWQFWIKNKKLIPITTQELESMCGGMNENK